ncbi:MAG: TonB-dependent receptor plug domain-containing protein [Puniceicoccaceae bacterium]
MKRTLITLLAGSLVGSLVNAQEATNEEEEVYELSPFVVESEGELGYMATNTLAGTRLNTELKDVGAAVSVYTEEFIDDIGVNNLEDILTYTTSSEGGGMDGNYSSITGEGSDDVRDNPSGVNRVRSLSNATRTRDYFESAIPTDSYNFSNLTMSRGPNAILAGIGSAGGIIDASLRQAQFREDKRLVYRYGEYNSHRGELHWNMPIIDDRLAVRLDAMYEDRNFRQDPTYEEDQRLYGAVKWNLRQNDPGAFLGRTTVRANIEIGSIDGVPPNPLTPVVSFASWFDGVDPRDGEPWAEPKWRANGALRKQYDANGYQDGSGTTVANADIIQGFPLFRQFALVFSDPNSGNASVGLSGDLAGVQGYQGVVPAGKNGPGGYLRGSGDRNRNRAGFTRTRLLDREVFDFYNNLLTGSLDSRHQSFDAVDVRLEQLFLNGKAGVEFAYNQQNFARWRDFPVTGQNEIFIDTTEYLSIRTDAFNTGGPLADQLIENPNFGRPFIVARDAFRDQLNSREFESYQATAYLRHDFTDADSSLLRLLGRHTLSGLYFNTTQDSSNRTWRSTWNVDGDLSLPNTIAAQAGTFGSQVNAHFYIGDSMVNAATESDVRLQPITLAAPEFGQTYTIRGFDTQLKEFVSGEMTPKRVYTTARDQREEIESYAFALQSHWLSDHLVTLVGWRNDSSDTFTSIDPPRLPDGDLDISNLELVPASSQSKDSWTKSVVLKFPEALFLELPFDSDMRFYWNTSENFDPVGQRRNLWNEEVGSPTAETEEYGIMLSTFSGKIDIRVNWFETTIKGAAVAVDNPYGYTNTMITRMVQAHQAGLDPQEPSSDPNDPDGLEYSNGPNSFQTFEEVARAFYATIPQRLQDNIGPDKNFNPQFVGTGDSLTWETDNVVNRSSLSDLVSKGTEIEVVYNPTRNWRIAFNISRNEAVRADVAVDELLYVDEWITNTNTMFNGELANMVRNPGTNDGSWQEQYQRETVSDIQVDAALSGTSTPEIRQWRANLVTRYEFRDGILDGFRIGGAMRWQDIIGIGYPFIENENGDEVADIDNPYFGPEELYFDLNLGYNRKIKAFGQDFDWTITLNIRNITGQDDLIPIAANADGSYGTVRIPPDRTWTITNSFRW